MAVLYRKYRPQIFADVVNQKHIIQTLTNQVKSGSVSHAYLFTGSRGVGKTSVARILAKAVNCERRPKNQDPRTNEGDACGVCDVCKQIEQGNFIDLVEIDAASNTGVENVRELIEHVKFSPSLGKYKVFIIDEVHMLSKQAFNALLKTLEEPPKHAIFILATTEINKVLPTIISRTQRFDFKALSEADILEHLQNIAGKENLKLSKEVLELVSSAAEGSVRDALSLLDKLTSLGDEATLEEAQTLLGITDTAVCEKLLAMIIGGQAAGLPEFFDELMQKGTDFKILNRDFLEYLRKALVYKVTGQKTMVILSSERLEKLAELAGGASLNELMFIIRLFLRSYKDLDNSPSAQIPLLLASLEAALKKIDVKPSQAKPSAPVLTPKVEIREEPKPAEEISPSDDSSTDTATMDEVQAWWPKIIDGVKKINGPLANLLKNCELMNVEGNKIIVGVKFLFNKQHIDNVKNSETISQQIHLASGKKLRVRAQVTKEEKAAAEPAMALTDALKVFGGELIE